MVVDERYCERMLVSLTIGRSSSNSVEVELGQMISSVLLPKFDVECKRGIWKVGRGYLLGALGRMLGYFTKPTLIECGILWALREYSSNRPKPQDMARRL